MSMEFKLSKLVPSAVVLLGALVGLAMGCGSTRQDAAAGRGRLAVALTDAPAPEVKEIWVTIDKVTAHSEQEGWVTVKENMGLTLDLLKLKDSTLELGVADLDAGAVSEVRLHLLAGGTHSITTLDGTQHELTVPSGLQSGIKVKGPFNIAACETTHVLLDFDAERSIFAHPTGAETWILRPVIHMKKTESESTGCTDDGDVTPPPQPPGGAGDACTMPADCLSGVCAEGMCAPGAPGAPCSENNDCASGTCTSEGTCGNGPAVGAGESCNAPTGCLSGSCTNNVCDPGTQGTPCGGNTDCAEGFTCQEGSCTAPPPVIG
ncbi:MAG: DUF4382 domain-containing protein [Myxococcaceae bacterium]|nr:DUF4382 domain-containing protein [Myxococcaceae bacterium]